MSSLKSVRALASTVELLEKRRLFSSYYDNGQENKPGIGTQASPWNSLYSISTYTGFHSGDVVKLSGTFNNQILFLGNAARGVTLTSADSNNPATISESADYGFNNAIQVTAAGITISYLDLVGPGITSNSNSFYAINFDNTGTVQFTGATVDHVNESGFVFGGLNIQGNTSGFTNVTVTNSTFNDNQVSGLVISGSGTTAVHSNVLVSNVTASGNAGHAIYYNANNIGATESADNGGIFVSSIEGGVIAHCTAIGNCYDSFGAGAIWAHNCDNLDVEYCEAADTRTILTGFDGNGFDFDHDVSNSIMQYDYSHGNDGIGLYLCSFDGAANNNNDTIRFCISDDDGRDGNSACRLYGTSGCYVTNANIYNNTLVTTDGSEVGFEIDGKDNGAMGCTVNLLNNVICTANDSEAVAFPSYFPSLSNVKMEGNDYWVTGYGSNTFKLIWGNITYNSLSSFVNQTGEETINDKTVGLNVDPLLNNETVNDLPIANIGNLGLSNSSSMWGAGQILTAAPFSNTSPYSNDAPYNLAGTAWNGIGAQDFFGNPMSQTEHNIGAGGVLSAMTFTGSSTGNTFILKADASLPNAVDVNGVTYGGVSDVIISGLSGNENVIADFSNGPFNLTFNGGTSGNTLTTENGTAAASITFTPNGGSNSLNVSAGTVMVPVGSQIGLHTATFSDVKINAGGAVAFASAASQSDRTLIVITGTFSLTGTLDLGSNDLDVKNGSASTLTNEVGAGLSGSMQGAIISTNANAKMTLGVIQNSTNGTPTGIVLYSLFDSAPALNSDVLVKYTYYGDDNLNGSVDASDLSRIDSGFLRHSSGWFNGDFNYDGVVNGSDFTLIDNAFNEQNAVLAGQMPDKKSDGLLMSGVLNRVVPPRWPAERALVPAEAGTSVRKCDWTAPFSVASSNTPSAAAMFSPDEWIDPSLWMRTRAISKPATATAIQAIENQ